MCKSKWAGMRLAMATCMMLAACTAPPPRAASIPAQLDQAAEAGNPMAQARLGHALLTGHGVVRDPESAKYWLEQAARAGVSEASRTLGLMHMRGDGVPRDAVKAREYLAQAADRSDPVAQGALGELYLRGDGVERDLGAASYWLTRSAKQGERLAMGMLGEMYLRGDVVESAADGADAADRDSTHGAINSPSVVTASGEPDFGKGLYWLRRAAGMGVVRSQGLLAELYLQGRGVAEDRAAAYYWFYLAAEQGDEKAREWRDQLARSLSPEQLSSAREQAAETARHIAARRPPVDGAPAPAAR